MGFLFGGGEKCKIGHFGCILIKIIVEFWTDGMREERGMVKEVIGLE